MKTVKTSKTDKALLNLGLSVESSDPTIGTDDGWNHFAFKVTLKLNGKEIIAAPYRMGMGHVKLNRPPVALSRSEVAMFDAIKKNPYAKFTDQGLYLGTMLKVAQRQGLKPSLSDVLNSLLLDGEAFFSGETFESWCDGLGYDSDSRKAYAIWEECDKTGRLLQNSGLDLEAASSILQDY